jgi:hypothetical protein
LSHTRWPWHNNCRSDRSRRCHSNSRHCSWYSLLLLFLVQQTDEGEVAVPQEVHKPVRWAASLVHRPAAGVLAPKTAAHHWAQVLFFAKAVPMPLRPRMPPSVIAAMNLMALRREMLPLASPLASSSKERLVASWLTGAPIPQRAGLVSPAVLYNAPTLARITTRRTPQEGYLC